MTERYKERLFKIDAIGNLRFFDIFLHQDNDNRDWYVQTTKGLVGSTVTQTDYEEVSIKNAGRANEREGRDQALVQANSKYNKVLDKGYKEIPENIIEKGLEYEFLKGNHNTGSDGTRMVMLAQKDTNKITFPGRLQRKYDGVRCKAFMDKNGQKHMMSRRGKEFYNLDHILNEIPWHRMEPDWELDGELYVHGQHLGDTVSMIKTKSEKNLLVSFRIYDILETTMTFNERDEILEFSILDGEYAYLEKAQTFTVKDWERIDKLFAQFKREGYEGAMWRNPRGLYEPGKRSWNLIKIKDFMEEEFGIVGVNEATGRDAGTAIFKCQTKEGIEFDCRPMGTRELRAEYFERGDELIGEMLTVRFQNYTKDGKPFHLRGVTIRDYE